MAQTRHLFLFCCKQIFAFLNLLIKIIDEIIPEPENHSVKTLKEASRFIYDALTETIISLQNQNQKSRLIAREKKWNDLGKNTKFSGKIQRLLLGITRKIKI